MPSAQRMGDANSGGGIITSIPQSRVYINNLLACVDGSQGTSHVGCPDDPIHCAGAWQTSGGSSKVRISGIPANRTGDSDTCGHTRATGSPNVFIGG